MESKMMMWCALLVFLAGSPALLEGIPIDPAATAALPVASPQVAAAPVELAVATPGAVATPSVAVPPAVATPAIAAPVATSPAGAGGIITEHKNPDGSTITVTRYNGPLPASAFPGLGLTGFGDLHDSFQRNFYETQLHHQAVNQAILRNINALAYNFAPVAYAQYAHTPIPTYTNSYLNPYAHSFASTFGQGGFFNPFYNPYQYGAFNAYSPYGQQRTL